MKSDVLTEDPKIELHSVDLRFASELTTAEVDAIGDAAFAEYMVLLVEREAQAHIVTQDNPYEPVEPEAVASEDEPDSGDPRPKGSKVTGLRYTGLTDCPDCSRTLTSRGDDFICPRVPSRSTLVGKRGDIVACGRPR